MGGPITLHEAAGVSTLLLIGGLDTVASMMGRGRLSGFLRLYGDLAQDGHYAGSERSGLAHMPGATWGEGAQALPPLTLDALLANSQIASVLFDENLLMQPTMRIPSAAWTACLPPLPGRCAPPRLNAEVREIRRTRNGVRIVYRDRSSGRDEMVEGARAIITAPLPILARIPNDFSRDVKRAIASVHYSSAIKIAFESPPFWEDVQIYGGISFVGGETALIWYPSGAFQARRQVLLAAYSADDLAIKLGRRSGRTDRPCPHCRHSGDITNQAARDMRTNPLP